MTSETSRAVFIMRRAPLPQSQTFIADHATALRRYAPTLVTLHGGAHGLPLDGVDAEPLVPRGSLLQQARVVLSGHCPRFDALCAVRQPALLHVHFVTDALLFLPLVERSGLPLVVTAHGFDISIPPEQQSLVKQLLWKRLNRLRQRIAVLLCVSDYIRDLAIERGFPPERCHVHYLGIPVERYRRRSDRPPVPGRILFVGRLVQKKGADRLLRAAARLQAMGVAYELHIAGDGPERSALERLAGELGVPARFLGAIDRARVAAELEEAWLFSMPSLRAGNGDAEGLGLVYLEAQAAGVPVVAFDEGPVREAVLDGQTGLLARAGDIEDLATALAQLLGDPELRQRMAEAGVRHVTERFDAAACSRALERVYDDVLAGSGRATRVSPGSAIAPQWQAA